MDRLGKPLLLIHGADDEVLPPLASDDIYRRAQEPKRMVILEATGHRLLGVEDEVHAPCATSSPPPERERRSARAVEEAA